MLTAVVAATLWRGDGFHYEESKPKPQEEGQKYLWMGEELDRPPNLFDVNGQQLALPEGQVPSLINFDPQAFAKEGNDEAEVDLRASRPWGRVYIDGWPTHLQYMRGSFGGAPPAGPTELVAAQPEDACTQLANADDVKGKAAGAAGLIIVNNAEGNLHPPMPDAVDVQVFVAMVAKPAGNVVIKALQKRANEGNGGLMARLIPINCHDSGREIGAGEPCQATTMAEREVLTSRVLGGNLKLMGSEGNDSSFEYLVDAAGKAVLVIRGGGCDFARKAKQAQAAGAAAIIVYSK
ncbi:hypothetical protein JKP88DRAFT_333177 [Tribonema minus]|uniref:PA domain-containing protein n=1 Tax=Tribonema minus TaxID=303371 RepID=A0A836C8Q4_9STRA|nr:hypothetical protein JKP88DRAFT_333177 [Tribonema minus]